MPKKIPDLETKIIDSASKLFASKGYSAVAMKDVADSAGTSVGNLYNYYPAKKDLFLAVRKTWFKRFDEEYSAELRDTDDPMLALRKASFRLLDMTDEWGGLWEEFIASAKNELTADEVTAIRTTLKKDFVELILKRLDALIRKCAGPKTLNLQSECDSRLASALMTTIKMLPRMYPGQRKTNRAFLASYIRLLCDEE